MGDFVSRISAVWAAAALVLSSLWLAGCGEDVRSPEPEPVASGMLVLGKISREPRGKILDWQPLTNHLAAGLHEFDIGAGEVRVAPDFPTMAHWLATGEVDIFIDSFYPALLVSARSGAEPVLLSLRSLPDKRTLFFTRSSQNLTSLHDLIGRVIVLEDRESTSGFMLPVAHLLQAGLRPVHKSGPDAPVAAGEVGYMFGGEDATAILWVMQDRVVAGAANAEQVEQALRVNPGILRVLAETEGVLSNHVVVMRPGLSLELRQALEQGFLQMHETAEGRALLEQHEITSFAAIEHEADRFEYARALFELVEAR